MWHTIPLLAVLALSLAGCVYPVPSTHVPDPNATNSPPPPAVSAHPHAPLGSIVTALAPSDLKPIESGKPSAPEGTRTPFGAGPREGFAIYLTADSLSVAQMQTGALALVRPAATPIISGDDIIAYRADGHELELSAAARERLRKLHVPVNGVPFLVCMNGRPIYWGAFWTPLSSLSFDGLVIEPPLAESDTTVRIGLGYP
jgi:hypothetical protein